MAVTGSDHPVEHSSAPGQSPAGGQPRRPPDAWRAGEPASPAQTGGPPDGGWSVDDHLRGKPAASVALYRQFVALLEACGPFSYAVAKTTITFKGSRRGFAGARPTAEGLTCYLDLQRVVEDPRITSAAPYTKRLFVHHLRITRPEQLDDELAGWVREAYAVGQGAHVGALAKGES
ncbi:MAG TPA: DUF5655 domain-containing protein [Streptosporangiaceae bacterium]